MISSKALFIFIIVLNQYYYYGYGAVKDRSISKEEEEDLELERQVKILNKTPIKSIKIGEGQIIDCVNIHKQPAFDHPLLKNHTIQMKPSRVLRPQEGSSSSSNKQRKESVVQKVDCPEGTVPIRRTSKEYLKRIKSFTESWPSAAYARQKNVLLVPGQHVALVETPDDGEIFYGISGKLNAQNPMASSAQSSSFQFWVENGAAVDFNTLQVGWIVSPILYNNTGTHSFGFWRVEGPMGRSCFNALCPGFVQVDKEYFIGGFITPTSFYGSDQYDIPMRLYQDDDTGNWWYTVTSQEIHMGYWPKDLFPNLSQGTRTVAWGGAVKDNGEGQGPPMGNGHFPEGENDLKHGSYIGNMKVYNGNSEWEQPPDSEEMELVVDNDNCYGLRTYGYVDSDFEQTIQFGGPGGNCR